MLVDGYDHAIACVDRSRLLMHDEVAPTAPKGEWAEAFGSLSRVRGSPLRNPLGAISAL
jgi:hypothetical protein